MESVNALQLRQSLGKIIARLRRTKRPILLKKGREPVGVLISLEDFEERFAEKEATERRLQLLEEIEALARPSTDKREATDILRNLRGR
jgi:prevent-host-death family protein